MKKKALSIIIPVYNVEAYLEQCVKSILDQSTPEVEVILVDDGSTDDSGKLCDKFAAQSKELIVVHQENGGLSAARNTGLRFATGRYITFVDSDDFIGNNSIQKILSWIETWTNTAAVVLQLDIAYRTISSTRDKIEKAFSIPCLNVLMSDKFHLKYVADEAYYYAKKAVKQQKSQNPFIDAVAQEEVKPLVSDVVLPEYKRAPVAPRGRKPKRDLAERTRARTIRRAARKEQRKLDNYAKGVYRAQQS